MAVTLYDQFGRPIERKKAPERRPLAVAPVLDSLREYVSDGITPERLATVFKEADQGNVDRQAQLFEQLEEKDGHLLCERDKRRNVILSLDWKVEPAADDQRSVDVAGFVEEFFRGYADWDDCLVSLQDAVGKGYAALEVHWDVSSGQAVPARLDFLEQKRFRFTDTSGLLRRTPLLLTDEDLLGVEIPAWKVIMHRYGGKSGHPARSGIYRVAAWMVLFKHFSVKDWLVFCEVYGMPLRLGKYDQGASDADKSALVAAISSLGSDAAGIISKSTEIEFVEAARGSTATDLWKLLADFCNAEISKALLGQTLSAEVGDRGSYAAARTHEGVRLDLLRADGRALAATIRDQLIRPLVGFNFGWDTPAPGYRAIFEEQEDLGQKAEWVEKITNRMAVPASWLRREFRIPEPEKGEEMVGGPQPVPVAARMVAAKEEPMTRFTAEQQAIEDLADRAMAQVDLAPNEEKILQAVRGASSYEEAMTRLLETWPDLDMATLEEGLARASVAAMLFGRRVVQDAQA